MFSEEQWHYGFNYARTSRFNRHTVFAVGIQITIASRQSVSLIIILYYVYIPRKIVAAATCA